MVLLLLVDRRTDASLERQETGAGAVGLTKRLGIGKEIEGRSALSPSLRSSSSSRLKGEREARLGVRTSHTDLRREATVEIHHRQLLERSFGRGA
jgi:hypothetical protein